MSAYLRIEHLSKIFGQFKALDDISLEIDEGDFVCFLGPSGCGKTTLLRAIAGLDLQSSGRIHQRGVDISPLAPAERDFGIVFQSYALFPNLTVHENVEFGLRNIGQRGEAARKRVAELLALVGISEQANKYPAQLSGGQQQRVALARALAISPGLLLLDEPLSALDAQVRVNLRNELRALQKQVGVTTIMVTHDQEEALAIADKIVVMNHGKVEQYGSPIEIYRNPSSPFVARFVGEMNFLQGEVRSPGRIAVGSHVLDFDEGAPAFGNSAKVTIAIRPEDIILRMTGETPANAFTGIIERMSFLGPAFRLHLSVKGENPLALIAVASSNAAHDLQLEVGRDIPFLLPAARLKVFPGNGAQTDHGDV